MDCYGKRFKKTEQCKTCELAEYCKDAGDPPLISHINADNLPLQAQKTEEEIKEEPLIYTVSQMVEIIRMLIELEDPRIRTILKLKLANPDISLSEIGEKYGVSKQAIDKDIKLAIAFCPALEVVLCNRPLYNRWRSYTAPTNPNAISRKKSSNDDPWHEQLTFSF
ncbi:MAG: helix-turn-helix domain-containing protein [Lentisphaeria bacterium]|nr:helix-turn-helix domain-containing protein [Lentisphaeria bacterium]